VLAFAYYFRLNGAAYSVKQYCFLTTRNYFAPEYFTMVRVITQDTFDEAVKENMEEFDMNPEEAVKEAVEQFEAQV
jgi:hypothetical protein